MRFYLFLLLLLSSAAFGHEPDFAAEQIVIMDYNSGDILYEKNGDVRMTPSSMSKLMTLYIVFSDLKSGKISLDSTATVSNASASIGGSTMFLYKNQIVKIRDLIMGAIVLSGNDACIALAEAISGSQEKFVVRMNDVAQNLGLYNSHFANATGWPDPAHYMTARDLMTLSIKIFEDFPEYYPLFSEKSFSYNKYSDRNTNDLLLQNIGVDGIKTGYTEMGGAGLSVSAIKNGRRIFAVFNGIKTKALRKTEGLKIVNYAFNAFESVLLFSNGEIIDKIKLDRGSKSDLPIVATKDLYVTFPSIYKNKVEVKLIYKNFTDAPIHIGEKVAQLAINIPNEPIKTLDLYAQEEIESISLIKYLFRKIFSHGSVDRN